MSIFKDPPLSVPVTYVDGCSIRLALEEPLFGPRRVSKRTVFNMLTVLDVLVSKGNVSDPTIRSIVDECEQLCAEYLDSRRHAIAPGATGVQTFIANSGLDRWFTKITSVLGTLDSTSTSNSTSTSTIMAGTPFATGGIPPLDDTHTRDDFTLRVSQLNIAYSIALQLRMDLTLPNCRYIAHQVALLYVALQTLGPQYKPFQTRIQGRFAEIKKTAGKTDSKSTRFNEEQIEWMLSLADDIVSELLFREDIIPAMSA